MPYPIPDKPWSSEFRYFLVAVPDDRGFIRAVKGHFGDLGNYWMWGEEGPEPDSNDAAQRMLQAIDETWRLIEMGWPDDVIAAIDEIEPILLDLLAAGRGQYCCDSLPGSGDVVAADDTLVDTSDTDVAGGVLPDGMDDLQFADYLCGAANAYVDSLIELPDRLTALASGGVSALITLILVYAGGAYIGIAGALFGVITIGAILDLLDVAENVIKAIREGNEVADTVAAQELNAAREDLVCAIYTANDAEQAAATLRGAIGDALTSPGWTNLLTLWPHETLLAKVFNGDATNAPEGICDCEPYEDLVMRAPISVSQVTYTGPQPPDPYISGGQTIIPFSRGVTVECTFDDLTSEGYTLIGYTTLITDYNYTATSNSLSSPTESATVYEIHYALPTDFEKENANLALDAKDAHYAADPDFAAWWDSLDVANTESGLPSALVRNVILHDYSGADDVSQYIALQYRAVWSRL